MAIRLTKVEMRGVTRFAADEPLSISLDALGPGVIAVVGGNGSGKTTLLEAAIAALYRTFPSRPGWYENFSRRDAFIEASFWDVDRADEVTVRIAVDAERRTTEQYVLVNGASVTTGRAKEAELEIEKRFGSLSLVLASVFASQNKAGNFLLLPKRDRKALMAELLGLSYLEALHGSAREHRVWSDAQLAAGRARLADVEKETAAVPELERVVTALALHVKHLEADATRLREAESAATARLETARVASKEVEGLRRALVGADRELDQAVKARRAAELHTNQVQEIAERQLEAINATDPAAIEKRARERHARVVAELAERRSTLGATAARRVEIESAERELVDLSTEIDALQKAEEELNALAGEAVASRRELELEQRALSDSLRRMMSEKTRLEHQAGLLSEVPCIGVGSLSDSCKLLAEARGAKEAVTTLTGEISALDDARVLAASAKLERVREEHEKLALASDPMRLDELERRAAVLRSTVDLRPVVERAVLELDAMGRKLEDADSTLAREVEEVAAAEARSQRERERIEKERSDALAEAQRRLDDAMELFRECERRREKAEADLGAAAGSAGDIAAAEKDRDAAVARLQANASALRSADGELARERAKLELLQEKVHSIKGLRADVASLEEAVGHWRLLAQALGRDGIQALEIDAAGPEVARLTNALLDACYGSRFSIDLQTLREKKSGRGEYSEVFDVQVFDRGSERVVEALSGGERVVVGEAIGLALAIFNSRKSGVRWRTLVRDETAGALDPANAAAYVDMLRRALRLGGFDQVLFVSHSEPVWERADARIQVGDGLVNVGKRTSTAERMAANVLFPSEIEEDVARAGVAESGGDTL